jgi:hypothetical protein
MFIIVMIMVQAGSHKVASDQILYPSMEMCEESRKILVARLMESKPTLDSALYSKCTELSFSEHKAALRERI